MNSETRSQKWSFLMLVSLAIFTFVVLTGMASALGAFTGGPADEPPADPSTSPRKAIASGDSPSIGKWTLWYSDSADGGKCVEIQFVDPVEAAVPPEAKLDGNVPVPGGGSLAGGCGASGSMTATTLTGAEHTLVFGIARGDIERVVVRGGGSSANARLFSPPGVDVKAYAHTIRNGQTRGLEVSGRGRDGREVAAQRPPTPSSHK